MMDGTTVCGQSPDETLINILGSNYMEKKFITIMLLSIFVCVSASAQRMNIEKKSPTSGWEFSDWSVRLEGRSFSKYELSQSWCEQSGYAMVNGRRLFYWLYDTISYHGGKADAIYNRYLPFWVEELGYVIDYDNIEVTDPNSRLASSVKALMQQRGADVSVTITTGPVGHTPKYDIDYLIVNEWFPSRGVYKTTIYPLLFFYEGF